MLFVSLLLQFSVLPLPEAMESGIVGGKEAKPHSRPYMVSVQNQKGHLCGGMLVKKDFVMTSAHCADHVQCGEKSQLSVLLGAHNISQAEKSQQRIEVKECIKHPSYQAGNFLNDIMLLKLRTAAKLNKNVDVLNLPKKDKQIPANQYCLIAGWGMKKTGDIASDVLMEVSLKMQFSFECNYLWKQYFDSRRMICSTSDGKRAFCQGDSGSPLICNNKLVGIAAYTFPGDCLNRKYPEVYMKIPYFLPWIEKVMGKKDT